jgi:hypothetical protein
VTAATTREAIRPASLGTTVGIVVAIGLAVVSRRYVELPFLRRSTATKRSARNRRGERVSAVSAPTAQPVVPQK